MEESRDLMSRLSRTAGLEPEAFQELAADRQATGQAGLVVLLAGLCAGLGALLAGRGGVDDFLGRTVAGLIYWLVSSWFVCAVGVLVFRADASYGKLLRTVGFAHGPLMLRLLRFVPGFGGPIWQIVGLWHLCATVVAAREALGLTTGRALATLFIAGIVQQAFFSALSKFLLPFGALSPLHFLFG